MIDAILGAIHVGAIVRAVLTKLVSISVENIKLALDFKEDLKKLRSSFDMIEKVLYEAEMRQIQAHHVAVKRWLENIEDVAFQMDHALDKFNYVHLRRSTMKNKAELIFSGSNYFSRRRFGGKIRDINKKLELINKEAHNFGLQAIFAGAKAVDRNAFAAASMESDSFAVDPIFLGRDDEVSRIVEMLTTGRRTDEVFSVSIVGMGGLGKTTLARKVYRDRRIMSHFGARSWVHVSQSFDQVFKKFLTTLTSQSDGVELRERILRDLEHVLHGKTYLLVLDDVWYRDSQNWEVFMSSLKGVTSTKGNAIIVTSRDIKVASEVKALHIHSLNGLSDEDCWSIIREKSFGEELVPSGIETIGKRIATRCQGLPLAANVVGGVLRSKSGEEWLQIEKNWLSFVRDDENHIKKILRLSFDYLPSPLLKKCFTYCSIFPKGGGIEREEVIELWMAEGFLHSDKTNDAEMVGSKFLDLLLQSSLLQAVERDRYNNVMRYGMHELVHDLAISLLDSTRTIRYIGYESKHRMEKSKYVRTLFYRDGDGSSTMLLNFKRLHTLTLTGDAVTKLSESIKKLKLLRYLNISSTGISCLPNKIDQLCFLETFRANGVRLLKKLPDTFTYLVSLRHLHVDAGVDLPPYIGRMISLQILPHFRVSSKRGCRIDQLGSLKNLKGKLRIHNLEKVHGRNEANGAKLNEKPNLFKVKFAWDESIESGANAKNVLEGLQPHPNLKSLSIQGFKGEGFPLWTLKMAVTSEPQGKWRGFDCLKKIKLSNCNCEKTPMMGHLPQLESLYLKGLPSLRTIDSSFYGIENIETSIVFPALRRLTLADMPNLTAWAGVEFPSAVETRLWVFPRLEYLRIYQCNRLKIAPDHFPCLKELDFCEIDSSLPLANICGMRLRSLTELSIERIFDLEYLPRWLFCNNQSLSSLKIKQCPRLRELPDGLNNLTSLKSVSMVSLSSLSKSDQSRIIASLKNLPHQIDLTINA